VMITKKVVNCQGEQKDILHDAHNGSLDIEAARIVVLLLRLLALLVALDLVAGADDADLDLDELALEVVVEGEAVSGVDFSAHGLLDEESGFGGDGERL